MYKPCISKCGAYYKTDHNLTVTKSICIRIKYTNNEAIKTNSSCGINKAAYNNSRYLRLSGKGG